MKTGKYIKKTSCRLCKSKSLKEFLNMGFMPHAGDFLEKDEIGKEKFYPLRLFFCKKCNLVQICDVPDRSELFTDYKYASSYSLKGYFENYADELSKILKKGSFVAEIGSNDGVLLAPLKARGFKVLGIDPAKNIADLAIKRGIKTLVGYFGDSLAVKIVKKYAKPDYILANNVMAHIDDMDSVACGIRRLLKKDGLFIFEVQYLPDLIRKMQYDFFYNEHLSYYSLGPLIQFWNTRGMEVVNVVKTTAHGGSIRVYVRHQTDKVVPNKSVKKLIDSEKKQGYYNLKTYTDFAKKVRVHKKKLYSLFSSSRFQKPKLVGYGASGRANTLLNYLGIDTSILSYIVDESPLRYGKFTPGSRIPIKSLEFFKSDKRVKYCVMFAESYKEAILEKNLDFIKRGGVFIFPLRLKV